MNASRPSLTRIAVLVALASLAGTSLALASCNAVLGIGDHSLDPETPSEPGATGGTSGSSDPGEPSGPAEASTEPTPTPTPTSGSGGSPSADGGGSSPASLCGNPGDPGNVEGVGTYCDAVTACTTGATFCSSVGNPSTHFCTRSCSLDADAGECGGGAMCTEEQGVFVCVPDACLGALDPADAGGAPSLCGNPGDNGNTAGIGRYCSSSSDCTVASATICSSIGDPRTHFCTELCSLDGGGNGCSEMASCAVADGVAICVPDRCAAALEDGG